MVSEPSLTGGIIRPLDPAETQTHDPPLATDASPTVFILGAGSHIGLTVSSEPKQGVYKVPVGPTKPLQGAGLVPITVGVSNTGRSCGNRGRCEIIHRALGEFGVGPATTQTMGNKANRCEGRMPNS